MKDQILFQTFIIQNTRYKKYRKLRGVFFLLLICLGTPLFFMTNTSSNRRSFFEDLAAYPFLQYYYIGMLIIGLLYAIIHYTTWRIKKIGVLKFSEVQIKIEQAGKQESFQIVDLQKVVLERGSTFHKEEDNITKPYQGDNWLEIHYPNDIKKYEFLLENKAHSESFEDMIYFLRNKYNQKIVFRSI